MVNTMTIIHRLMGGKTLVEKFDTGNGFARFKCKEDDHFIRFRDRGTLYLILKTIPPKIDKFGNRLYFTYETDIHTFEIESGKILDEQLEKEFKERIKLEELTKFKDMMKEVEEEAIQDRAREILKSMSVSKDNEEEEETALNINLPYIKLGKTSETHIDNLTPHDTINEVNSLILDGKLLKALLTSAMRDKWVLLGAMIVGSALTIVIMTLVAIMFPEQWGAFMS